MTDSERRRAWRAVAALFALSGGLFGLWASRVPAVRDALELSKEALGAALLFMAGGAICAFPLAGRFSDALGAARASRLLACAASGALLLLPLAQGFWTLAVGLLVFGAALGGLDVCMNAWGGEVETRAKRTMMSGFHALFSLGAGLGSLSGYAAAALGFGFGAHALAMGGAMAVAALAVSAAPWESAPARGGPLFALPRGALALAGAAAFCAMLGEGAVADWGALYLRDVAGATERAAALGFAAFSAAMVVVRLGADRGIRRFGPVRAARASGVCATLGALLAVAAPVGPAVLAGFALMGAGYAVVMPLACSRATCDPETSAGQAMAAVATLGYGGALLGPPVIGFIAGATSLRAAFLLLAALSLGIVALAGALATPARRL